ncbi:MAG: secretin N-terminal domain-containing protein [Planctomycetota bacterium]
MKNCFKAGQLKMLLALLLILGFCVVGIAQDAEEAAEEEKVLSAVGQKMLKRISVDFRDTPIDDVIITIGKQVDLDIVKGPDVTGNVTATLTDVPLEEALNHILTAYGAGFVASENMIRIVPASQLTEETEKMVSKVYRIVYADVKEVEKVLAKAISKRGTISANPGTSNIMITDTESKIAAIDTFVEEMDRRTVQLLVEARIYDITSRDTLDLGVEWYAGRNTGYGTGFPTIDQDSGRLSGGPITGYSRSDPSVAGTLDSSISQATQTTGTLRFGVLNEHVDIEALITASQGSANAKLLASPRILVLDNETANFKAVREIPYQRLTQGGYQSFGTTEFKDVGVELQVTPHLAKDGMIRLHILPIFSVQVDSIDISTIGTGGTVATTPQPVVDKREADTITLVEDGTTVVIGGLRKEEVITEASKIPLLGDLPILGALFKFEGETTINSELVVFITPHIVEDPVLTETEAEYLEATEISGPKPPTTRIDPATGKIRL